MSVYKDAFYIRVPGFIIDMEVAAEEQPPDGGPGGGSRGPLAAPLLDGDLAPRDAPACPTPFGQN